MAEGPSRTCAWMDKELHQIIEKCKANDHKAFEWVYKRYYKVLLGVAARYCSNIAEAEDILQDAFIKVFHSIRSYQGKGSFEGWLKRIVQNTAINQYRSNLKFGLHIEVSEEENKISDDSFSSVFDLMDAKESLRVLNAMPEGYRLVLNLYCIDGYSHKEIADMLGVTIGTSKSQLYKAKNYLKKIIEIQNQEKIV